MKWTSDLWLIKDKPWWWFHSTSFADKSREVSRCTLENPQLKRHICTPLRCFCQQPSPPDWCKKKLSYCCTNGRLPVAVHSQLPDIATGKKYGWIRSSCSDFYETWRPFNSLCFVHGAENGCNMKRGSNTHTVSSFCLGMLRSWLLTNIHTCPYTPWNTKLAVGSGQIEANVKTQCV